MISDVYDAPVWAGRETIESIPPEYPSKILREGDRIFLQGPSEISSWEIDRNPRALSWAHLLGRQVGDSEWR